MLFGALGTRDLLLDRGEPFGVLPGTALKLLPSGTR
jgi:hypothetical protein